MSTLEIPNFGRILAEPIRAVPEASRVGFIARLERAAAGRYREWAAQDATLREGLLACADREDEIASRAEKLMPVLPEHEEIAQAALDRARALYAAAFEGHGLRDCMILQAHAERQGSLAWHAFAAQAGDEATKRALRALAAIEIESADFIDAALGVRSTDRV